MEWVTVQLWAGSAQSRDRSSFGRRGFELSAGTPRRRGEPSWGSAFRM